MENNPELESFRRQWLEEVSARTRRASQPAKPPQEFASTPGKKGRKRPPRHQVTDRDEELELEDTGSSPPTNDYQLLSEGVQSLSFAPADDDTFAAKTEKAPFSALEHFEEAVKKEAQGNLGDSLNLYRKAYKVNHGWCCNPHISITATNPVPVARLKS